MNINQKLLSDLTIHDKYAKWIPELNRKENWNEIVERNKQMHLKRYPELSEVINKSYQFVFDKKILPSMRSLQFAGGAIESDENRIYNCAYIEMNRIDAFGEVMFNLLCGTGQGYSVQFKDIQQLPFINKCKAKVDFEIKDNKEGWADSIIAIMKWAFGLAQKPIFDYSFIRHKGTLLKTSGGKAPGRQPLVKAHNRIFEILKDIPNGTAITPFQVHLINCIIADAVVSGGIRRAALICLFSQGDTEMFTCKIAGYRDKYPELDRSNNSVILLRETYPSTEDGNREFRYLLRKIFKINTGEPGIFWTNDFNMGLNPCAEISLYPDQFCNLVEINGGNIESEEDFIERCVAASTIATLQAGFTHFHYLRDNWKTQTELEALIGVGITGICSNTIDKTWLRNGARKVNSTNVEIANLIGIKPAARTTTIKPSGSTSLVLGTSSGIHAYYSEYFIRRITVYKSENVYKYFKDLMPELVEDSCYKSDEAYICIPVKAPEGSTFVKDETAIQALERIKYYNLHWVREGWKSGANSNNVSASVYYTDEEISEIKTWLWANRDHYVAISLFPYLDNSAYPQLITESITKEKYEELNRFIREYDLDDLKYYDDNTNFIGDAIACAGGACEIEFKFDEL